MNDSVQNNVARVGSCPDAGPNRFRKLSVWVAWAAAALVLVYTARTLVTYLPAHSNLNHVSATWVTLAADLAHGTFYRPLWSPDGYGGTRYLPLHFTLHAALIRLGMDFVDSGHLMTILSAVALLAGAYCLMRVLGAGWALALPCSILILGPMASQVHLTRIGGDLLAAALNVWGMVFCVKATVTTSGRRAVVMAAVLFSLAFAAKVTGLYGAGAGVVALLLAGRRQSALRLFVFTSLGVVLVLACTYAASAGRFLETMAACASGGTRYSMVLLGPDRLIETAMDDRGRLNMVLLVTSLGGLLLAWRRCWRELPVVALLASVVALCLIFGSRGTADNHLIDFTALSLVFLAVQTARRRFTPALLCIVSASVIVMMVQALATHPAPGHAEKRGVAEAVRVVRRLGDDPRHPVLSLDPLLPVMAGQRPYLLDRFMYYIIAERFPAARRQMAGQLESHYFGAVIMARPKNRAPGSLEELPVGERFREEMKRYYVETEYCGNYIIYRPKAQ